MNQPYPPTSSERRIPSDIVLAFLVFLLCMFIALFYPVDGYSDQDNEAIYHSVSPQTEP